MEEDAFSGTIGMTPISSFAPVPMEEEKLRDLIAQYLIESGFPFRHVEIRV
jgi:hypothetical protein